MAALDFPSSPSVNQVYTSGALSWKWDGTSWIAMSGTSTFTSFSEIKTAPSISAGSLTLDCSLGNVFAVSLNASVTTLSFTNVPASGNAFSMTLALTGNGSAFTITWPSSVKWPGAFAPVLTSTNAKTDLFVFATWDGGTTWYAAIAGQNL